MKIINGNDYYDKAMSYGIDNSVVFVRNTVKGLVDLPIHVPLSSLHTTGWLLYYKGERLDPYNSYNSNISGFSVIVAGKQYFGVTAYYRSDDNYSVDTQHFYDYGHLENYLGKRDITIEEPRTTVFKGKYHSNRKSRIIIHPHLQKNSFLSPQLMLVMYPN